jgi:hypothetical protein
VNTSEVTHSEEKHPEEKVDISLLSQGNENQTHEESEISSLEGMETDIQDDSGSSFHRRRRGSLK